MRACLATIGIRNQRDLVEWEHAERTEEPPHADPRQTGAARVEQAHARCQGGGQGHEERRGDDVDQDEPGGLVRVLVGQRERVEAADGVRSDDVRPGFTGARKEFEELGGDALRGREARDDDRHRATTLSRR
ncbi:MAG: hypothetical protein EA416_05365 [Trueperaceae bacterium]|nr:MAG: hypothetical protein EA416_05365 [Trueperaceae bacterium]